MMGIPTENHDKSLIKFVSRQVILWVKTECMFEEHEDMHLCVGVAFKKLGAFTFPDYYLSLLLWRW
jgi:hypothetical protein